jgi:hypothetical protein
MEKFRYEEMLPHEIVARRKKFPTRLSVRGVWRNCLRRR